MIAIIPKKAEERFPPYLLLVLFYKIKCSLLPDARGIKLTVLFSIINKRRRKKTMGGEEEGREGGRRKVGREEGKEKGREEGKNGRRKERAVKEQIVILIIPDRRISTGYISS